MEFSSEQHHCVQITLIINLETSLKMLWKMEDIHSKNGLHRFGDPYENRTNEWGRITRESILIPALIFWNLSSNQDVGLDGLKNLKTSQLSSERPFDDSASSAQAEVASKQDVSETFFQYYFGWKFVRNNVKNPGEILRIQWPRSENSQGNANQTFPILLRRSNLPDNEDSELPIHSQWTGKNYYSIIRPSTGQLQVGTKLHR